MQRNTVNGAETEISGLAIVNLVSYLVCYVMPLWSRDGNIIQLFPNIHAILEDAGFAMITVSGCSFIACPTCVNNIDVMLIVFQKVRPADFHIR